MSGNGDRKVPRRPAMLDPNEAEAIQGDEDPAQHSEVAHTAAWALLGVTDPGADPATAARVRASVRADGVDDIAQLWSRSPAFTLPGALWRIFRLAEAFRRDEARMHALFDQGAARVEAALRASEHRARGEREGSAPGGTGPRAVDGVARADLPATLGQIRTVLSGHGTQGDLPSVLTHAAAVLRVLAAGSPPAQATRAQAWLNTARELEDAARSAEAGSLE